MSLKYVYEKQLSLQSFWNADHVRPIKNQCFLTKGTWTDFQVFSQARWDSADMAYKILSGLHLFPNHMMFSAIHYNLLAATFQLFFQRTVSRKKKKKFDKNKFLLLTYFIELIEWSCYKNLD